MYYVVYRDVANQWRWQLIAANHKIIAVSSESYWNRQDCYDAIDLVKASGNAPVYENS